MDRSRRNGIRSSDGNQTSLDRRSSRREKRLTPPSRRLHIPLVALQTTIKLIRPPLRPTLRPTIPEIVNTLRIRSSRQRQQRLDLVRQLAPANLPDSQLLLIVFEDEVGGVFADDPAGVAQVFVFREFDDEIAAARDVFLERVVVSEDGAVAFHEGGAGDLGRLVVGVVEGGGVRESEGEEGAHLFWGVVGWNGDGASVFGLDDSAVAREGKSDGLWLGLERLHAAFNLEVLKWFCSFLACEDVLW